MEKIIFLDFDGVLNTEHYQNLLYHEGKACQDEYASQQGQSLCAGDLHSLNRSIK